MGKFNSSNNNIWQQLTRALPGGVFTSPAYFNGTVYYADINGTLKAFPITNARLGNASTAQSTTLFPYPGGSPAVSANGTSNGIIWVHENSNTAVLHAFDATNLTHELYNSNQAANNRDHFGAGNKFITPAVADGKVFVGTQNSVAVFGLLQ
jgi:outer membrane protein assembly factor BamB